jgi:hypothetical protein
MFDPGSALEPGNGQPRAPQYSGDCRRHLIGPPASPHSSWYMGRRCNTPKQNNMFVGVTTQQNNTKAKTIGI